MANVKFNRGTVAGLANLGSNPFDQVTLVRDTATAGSTDYNSIYLGTALVGTSMLGLMKPQKMQTPTYTYGETTTTISWAEATIGTNSGNIASGVITTDVVTPNGGTATPMTTVRKLVDYATAYQVDGQGHNTYTPLDSEILTAKAVTALVGTITKNTYYGNFLRNETPNIWTYTAEDLAGINHPISITLPVATTLTATDNENVPTSKAVADFFAGYAGGMRYVGSITGSEQNPPTIPVGTKTGDVFIASGDAFNIPAGTGTSPVHVEPGDMIVIKGVATPTEQSTALTSDKCDVFERNIDGAITGSLTNGKFVIATGTNTVGSVDLIYDRVTQNSNALNTITVTTWRNQTQGTGDDVHTYTIDDIYHAKYVETVTASGTTLKGVIVDGTHDSTTGYTDYQKPAVSEKVQINPTTGEIVLTYQPTGAEQPSTINVAESITNINGILEWNDLA